MRFLSRAANNETNISVGSNERGAAVIGEMIGVSETTTTRSVRKAPLVLLLALGWVALLLALPGGPAHAATTFTVNDAGDAADIDLADDGCDSDPAAGNQCTFRAAIEESNDTSGEDAIDFGIGTTPTVKTISPASELPEITEALTIDGYTQPGSTPNTLATGNDAVHKVQLDGTNAGSGANGLEISGPGSTVKGLVIRSFEGYCVTIASSGAAGHTIEGNFLGTTVNGSGARGNGGVRIDNAPDNVVGGTQPGARNVISGNDGESGVSIVGSGATGNRVEGNYVGTSADGRSDLGNVRDGITINLGAGFTTVGGSTPGAGNRIAHNGADGIANSGSDSAGNTILWQLHLRQRRAGHRPRGRDRGCQTASPRTTQTILTPAPAASRTSPSYSQPRRNPGPRKPRSRQSPAG